MNKKELIKALFKNPTIKALYESGHFDASDINRAILMEASEDKKDTTSLIKQIEEKIKQLTTQRTALQRRIGNLKSSGRAKEAKPDVKERNAIDKKINELEQKANELRELAKADIEISKAAAETPSTKDDEVSQKVSTKIGSMLDDLKGKISQAKNEVTADNAESTLDQTTDSVSAVIPAINHLVKKEKDAVKAAQAGKEVDAEKTAKQLPTAKGWGRAKVSIRQRIKKEGLTIEQIKDSLKSVGAFKELFGLKSGVEEKMAQAQNLFDDGWIAGEIKRLAEKASQAQSAEAKQEVTELQVPRRTLSQIRRRV